MSALRATDAQDVGFLVIGSGPAGQKAAIQAAKAGREVWLVEREAEVGGACVRTGTIPSKTLRERARRPRLHGDPDPIERPLGELLDGVGEVVAAHDRYWSAQLERNGVRLVRGHARFVAPREVEVARFAGAPLRLRAARVVIATGSRPRAPSHLAIDHEHVLDSDSILSLAWLPRSLLVLGGGVIASEYASIFAALGCRVHQADRNARPLAFVDAELTDLYVAALRDAGGEFLAGRSARRLGWDGVSQVVTEFDDGSRLATDKALVALGRIANVEELQLEAAGVTLGASGHVEVDEMLETRASGVYAAGDVIGPPALASTAMEQGRRAACHALGLLAPSAFDAPIPSGIYSLPEISTVGLDEAAARARQGEVLVGRAHFAEIARGQISGRPRGLLKMVATRDGREVLGVQVAGDGATELVHVGQVGMMAGLGVDGFVDTIFNFPTLAEAYRVAALDIVRQRRAGASRPEADAVGPAVARSTALG